MTVRQPFHDPLDWPPSTRVAAQHEGLLEQALWSRLRLNVALVDQQALGVSAHGQDTEAVLGALRWDTATRDIAGAAEPDIVAGFWSGAELAAEDMRALGIDIPQLRDVGSVLSFDDVNPLAVEWAALRSAALVVSSSAVRDQIQALVAESVSGQLTVPQLARELREVVGLDPRRVDALAREVNRLVAAGHTTEEVARRAARYGARLQRARTLAIARTEASESVHAGQQGMWDISVAQGQISPAQMGKKWIYTPSGQEDCEICGPLDQVVVAIDAAFPGINKRHPPAHPNCRCSTGLVALPGARDYQEVAARVAAAWERLWAGRDAA